MDISFEIMKKKVVIPVFGLRRLLYDLKDLRPAVCIRFRILGRMWQPHFSKVVEMTEQGVILQNEKQLSLLIHDLRSVVQFEIDSSFQNLEPHFHYNVEYVKESAV